VDGRGRCASVGGLRAGEGFAEVPGRLTRLLHRVEGGVLIAAFFASMILPLVDALGRPFHGFAVPGAATYRAQLMLWLAFVGGLLATRERHHLTLSTAEAIGSAKGRARARPFSSSVARAVAAGAGDSAW